MVIRPAWLGWIGSSYGHLMESLIRGQVLYVFQVRHGLSNVCVRALYSVHHIVPQSVLSMKYLGLRFQAPLRAIRHFL
ncbi:hypothetical protein AFLA_009809 [Aspergillus flavus NRRL3357]|nr:hypothetical protein AFLA_009809 [Aspergillus flavus NRRL3357]